MGSWGEGGAVEGARAAAAKIAAHKCCIPRWAPGTFLPALPARGGRWSPLKASCSQRAFPRRPPASPRLLGISPVPHGRGDRRDVMPVGESGQPGPGSLAAQRVG
ncbi:unnamed protein product [Bubo scandiacus]